MSGGDIAVLKMNGLESWAMSLQQLHPFLLHVSELFLPSASGLFQFDAYEWFHRYWRRCMSAQHVPVPAIDTFCRDCLGILTRLIMLAESRGLIIITSPSDSS